MPPIPGFGAAPVPGRVEPVPLAPIEVAAAAPSGPADSGQAVGVRPAFFVQWKAEGMPGMTQRPRIDPAAAPPKYPAEAARREDSGVTTIESCVTVDGRLVDVKLARSSGSPTLDAATLAWAQSARISAAEFNGQPMAVCGWRLDYEWRLNDPR